MKKAVCLGIALALCMGCLPGFAQEAPHGNYSDDMKMERTMDLSPEDGADSVERMGDHEDSQYFRHPDFYNMESTETLTLLPAFRTMQQSSEWACGVTSALMVLSYYDRLDEHTEETLAAMRGVGLTSQTGGTEPGSTSLLQLIDIFEGVGGFDMTSTFDFAESGTEFTLETIQQFLKDDTCLLIGWNDWGGHWQVVIGYDTMGTETLQDDVLIVADPYDTTDHNQDGYGIYGAERFFYNFTFYNFFNDEDGNDQMFLAVKPAA